MEASEETGTVIESHGASDLEDGNTLGTLGGGSSVGSRDSGDPGKPWETSEDVVYFIFKIVAGNSLELLDYFFAAR